MVKVFQQLDAYSGEVVLLTAVAEIDIMPNLDESLVINNKRFVITKVEHDWVINEKGLKQDISIFVVPEAMMTEALEDFDDYR